MPLTLRDAAEFSEASYDDDPALKVDTLADFVREAVGDYYGRSLNDIAAETQVKLEKMAFSVVRRLLEKGQLGAMVDLNRLDGRELMARMLAEIIDAPEPRLMARCLDFIFQLGVQGGASETKMAALEGVTKATASRICCTLKETYLNGRPAAGMKSAKAVASYKANRTGRSSRGPRQEWEFAKTFAANLNIIPIHGPIPNQAA